MKGYATEFGKKITKTSRLNNNECQSWGLWERFGNFDFALMCQKCQLCKSITKCMIQVRAVLLNETKHDKCIQTVTLLPKLLFSHTATVFCPIQSYYHLAIHFAHWFGVCGIGCTRFCWFDPTGSFIDKQVFQCGYPIEHLLLFLPFTGLFLAWQCISWSEDSYICTWSSLLEIHTPVKFNS